MKLVYAREDKITTEFVLLALEEFILWKLACKSKIDQSEGPESIIIYSCADVVKLYITVRITKRMVGL